MNQLWVSGQNGLDAVIQVFVLVVHRREWSEVEVVGGREIEPFVCEFVPASVDKASGDVVVGVQPCKFAPEEQLLKVCLFAGVE